MANSTSSNAALNPIYSWIRTWTFFSASLWMKWEDVRRWIGNWVSDSSMFMYVQQNWVDCTVETHILWFISVEQGLWKRKSRKPTSRLSTLEKIRRCRFPGTWLTWRYFVICHCCLVELGSQMASRGIHDAPLVCWKPPPLSSHGVFIHQQGQTGSPDHAWSHGQQEVTGAVRQSRSGLGLSFSNEKVERLCCGKSAHLLRAE